MMKKTLFSMAMGLAALAAQAAPDLDVNQIKNALKTQVDGVAKLPVGGLTMIEANGKTFLVSDNGRIVVMGKIYDIWNSVELKTVEDAERYANRIDIDKLGLKPDELGGINIGTGKKEVIMFLDANCTSCNKLIQSALKHNDYTFKVILLPMLNDDSVIKAKKAICNADKQAVAKALIDNTWDKLPAPPADCIVLPLQKAMTTARVFGIQKVPFLVRNDGRVAANFSGDLGEWLSEGVDKQSGESAKGASAKKQAPQEASKQK
jgi:thiol:disulfide interchange protein DsbC